VSDEEEDDLEDVWALVRVPPRPKEYRGWRSASDGKCHVVVVKGDKSLHLPLCLNVVRHSPDGFEWNYEGSGPAQLAVAILCDHFGKGKAAQAHALRLHQRFKERCIAKCPHDAWTITSAEVTQHVREMEAQNLFIRGDLPNGS